MISITKIAMTTILIQSNMGSTCAEKKAVLKSSEKSEYRVSSVMKI